MIFELLMCLFVTHDLLAAHDCVGLLIVFLFNRLLVTFVFLMTFVFVAHDFFLSFERLLMTFELLMFSSRLLMTFWLIMFFL